MLCISCIEPITDPVLCVVVAVYGAGEDDLLEVGEAGDALCLIAGFREGGQQHGGENRDDGDDDEEFNQREVLFHVWFSFGFGLGKSMNI